MKKKCITQSGSWKKKMFFFTRLDTRKQFFFFFSPDSTHENRIFFQLARHMKKNFSHEKKMLFHSSWHKKEKTFSLMTFDTWKLTCFPPEKKIFQSLAHKETFSVGLTHAKRNFFTWLATWKTFFFFSEKENDWSPLPLGVSVHIVQHGYTCTLQLTHPEGAVVSFQCLGNQL